MSNKRYCAALQERLAELGVGAVKGDAAAQEHLAHCEGCLELFQSMALLDDTLSALPLHDPADDVVSSLLRSVETEAAPASPQAAAVKQEHEIKRVFGKPAGWRAPARYLGIAGLLLAFILLLQSFPLTVLTIMCWAAVALAGYLIVTRRPLPVRRFGGYATAAIVLLALSVTWRELDSLFFGTARFHDYEEMSMAPLPSKSKGVGAPPAAPHALDDEQERAPEPEASPLDYDAPSPPAYEPVAKDEALKLGLGGAAAERQIPIEQEAFDRGNDKNEYAERDVLTHNELLASKEQLQLSRGEKQFADNLAGPSKADKKGFFYRPSPVPPRPVHAGEYKRWQGDLQIAESSTDGAFGEPHQTGGKRLDKKSKDDESRLVAAAQGSAGDSTALRDLSKTVLRRRGGEPQRTEGGSSASFAGKEGHEAGEAAAEYFKRYSSAEGLSFQPAEGYWANTYLPGDPTFRSLHSILFGNGLDSGIAALQSPHRAALQPEQPFDAPRDAALAVYLHAEERAVPGSTRMRLQVGLKGADRKAGSRQRMNVCMVLDARGAISAETAEQLRSLVFAFNRAKDIGDRFCIVAAGRSEQITVMPEDFRHGALSVTLDKLFRGASHTGSTTLQQAFETALAAVSDEDDPTAPLGTSAIIFAGAQELGVEQDALLRLAHQSAVMGIPSSAVSVGAAERHSLEQLALAGQGARRHLAASSAADELIQRELSTVSESIARAVRLRIRLAPGVKLIGVLGSRRLDTIAAERVRQAEQSIDRRLARNLGIEADRGEDEEGIQIVLPVFQAGDAHVVLLDVVVPGPGPVADVTVRYKDLVQLKNGIARATLAVENGSKAQGPLEQNVTKNFLAFNLAATMRAAAMQVRADDRAAAVRELRQYRDVLAGLAAIKPELGRDEGIVQDLLMLDGYLAALGSGGDMSWLDASLRYSAQRKVQPLPATIREEQRIKASIENNK